MHADDLDHKELLELDPEGGLIRFAGKEISALAPDAADQLLRYEWPGNVRELENTMTLYRKLKGYGLINGKRAVRKSARS